MPVRHGRSHDIFGTIAMISGILVIKVKGTREAGSPKMPSAKFAYLISSTQKGCEFFSFDLLLKNLIDRSFILTNNSTLYI